MIKEKESKEEGIKVIIPMIDPNKETVEQEKIEEETTFTGERFDVRRDNSPRNSNKQGNFNQHYCDLDNSFSLFNDPYIQRVVRTDNPYEVFNSPQKSSINYKNGKKVFLDGKLSSFPSNLFYKNNTIEEVPIPPNVLQTNAIEVELNQQYFEERKGKNQTQNTNEDENCTNNENENNVIQEIPETTEEIYDIRTMKGIPFQVHLKPSRRKNTDYAKDGEFPKYICSTPYKYLIRISYPENNPLRDQLNETSFTSHLLVFRPNGSMKGTLKKGVNFKFLRTKIDNGTVNHFYHIQFSLTSFLNQKEKFIFVVDAFYQEIFRSNTFVLVARKNKPVDDKFWDRFLIDSTLKSTRRPRNIKKRKRISTINITNSNDDSFQPNKKQKI